MKVRLSEHGVHFFNRLTGANLLIDEVAVPKELWSAAPRHVSIALTNTCDLSCSYCYAPKKRAELDFDILKLWLREIDTNGSLGVGFGGGEPTLYRRFAELCQYATNNTSLAISFTTHGHHLDDNLLEKLNGNIHFVRVSVDGLETTYERLRKRSFNALRKRIIGLKEIVPFGINYVVNDDTFPELEKAVDFAAEIGASEFLLLPEFKMTGDVGFSINILKALQKFTSLYSKSLPLRISELSSDEMPVCDPYKNGSKLDSYCHVDAQGILKHTSYDNRGVKIPLTGFMDGLLQLRQQVQTNKNAL